MTALKMNAQSFHSHPAPLEKVPYAAPQRLDTGTTGVLPSPGTGTLSERDDLEIAAANQLLQTMTSEQRVQWMLEEAGQEVILTSSFGVQSAVSLHMTTQIWPEIPVVLIDTGYLFPQTYQFIDELTERLDLNLQIYRAKISPAWQEQRYGRLWEQGLEGVEKYNYINKVEPMQRALQELAPRGWIAGLRRQQASSRRELDILTVQRGIKKLHPIIEWTDHDVYLYLQKHGLPYHPLWYEGYASLGDVHTTSKVEGDMTAEETRFFGLKRECGIHEESAPSYEI